MITTQHTQEQLSLAYITAVAGCAGVILANVRDHDYGVDGTFRSVSVRGSKRIENGYALDFQLKSTVLWDERPDVVCYDCKADNYNKLAIQDGNQGAIPCVLLVLCLPQQAADWLAVSEQETVLKRCCYWYRVEGAVTSNSKTKRVSIPRSQLFTVDALQSMLLRVQQGQKP